MARQMFYLNGFYFLTKFLIVHLQREKTEIIWGRDEIKTGIFRLLAGVLVQGQL